MQISSPEWSDLLVEGADALDIDLNSVQTRQLALHAGELVRWNQKINLTAISDPLEVAVKHFLDSLAAARFIPMDATLLDIGSGGGFPGLPLKVLMPSLSVTLIDASRKKVSFLKHVIRSLKLENIEALHIRAQDLAKDTLYRNRFNVIISRALTSLKLFRSLALPLLIDEGILIAFKGERLGDDLNCFKPGKDADSNSAASNQGQLSVTVEKFRLPYLNSKRSIIIIKNRIQA